MSSISKQYKGEILHLVKIPKKYKIPIAKTAQRTLTEAGESFDYQKPVDVAIFSSHPEMVIPELGIGGNSIWFFGTKKLPRWIGYRLGYLLIDSFMLRANFCLTSSIGMII